MLVVYTGLGSVSSLTCILAVVALFKSRGGTFKNGGGKDQLVQG